MGINPAKLLFVTAEKLILGVAPSYYVFCYREAKVAQLLLVCVV